MKDRQYQFWERNPLSVDLWDAKVVEQKLTRAAFRYVHNNPLQEKWNLATHPADYWYSSYRFYHGGQDDFGFQTDFREEY